MDVHRNVKYEARILAKEIMNSKLNRLNIVTVCGTALLIAVALRSIARRRNLPKNDVDALLVYLRKADNAMRPERVAALKNDVMNFLRNQELPSKGLAATLIAMFKSSKHPPAVLD